nr:MAG TPA: hypothetical protein [Bacteriophage sp.]
MLWHLAYATYRMDTFCFFALCSAFFYIILTFSVLIYELA